MEIRCGNCRYGYDFKAYGERCPQCGFENKPFRSQSARRLMDYEDDSIRNRYFDNRRAERREALLRSGDPDYGKSPVRRIRKYLFLVALCLAVVMLGQTLMRFSFMAGAPEGPLEKPPVSELAAASFSAAFESVDGVKLLVKYTGTVPDESLGAGQQGRVKCVFVDLWATTNGIHSEFPGQLHVLLNDVSYPRRYPQSDGADIGNYTSFDFMELWAQGNTGGQIFFYLPPNTEKFTLCWQTDSAEQRMELHL